MDGQPGTPDEANPYDYVDNDPLNFTDPLGLCRTTDVTFRTDTGAVIEGPEGGLDWEGCHEDPFVECDPIGSGPYHVADTCSPDPDARHCLTPSGRTISGDPYDPVFQDACYRAQDPSPRPFVCQEYDESYPMEIRRGYPFHCNTDAIQKGGDFAPELVCRVAGYGSTAHSILEGNEFRITYKAGRWAYAIFKGGNALLSQFLTEAGSDLVLFGCNESTDIDESLEGGVLPPWPPVVGG